MVMHVVVVTDTRYRYFPNTARELIKRFTCYYDQKYAKNVLQKTFIRSIIWNCHSYFHHTVLNNFFHTIIIHSYRSGPVKIKTHFNNHKNIMQWLLNGFNFLIPNICHYDQIDPFRPRGRGKSGKICKQIVAILIRRNGVIQFLARPCTYVHSMLITLRPPGATKQWNFQPRWRLNPNRGIGASGDCILSTAGLRH